MNFNFFLDKEQRYKYYIVQLLEVNEKNFFSQGQLMKLLGISKYKIDKFLKDIEEDSKVLGIKNNVLIEESGELVAKGFDNLVTKKLRLYYLKQSKQYQLLHVLLMDNKQTAESLMSHLFISRASIYNELKILKKNLRKYNINIKNWRIVGPELTIRSFFFSLFNEFYCGLDTPFPSDLNQKVDEFKQMLFTKNNIFCTRVQEYRLSLFIGISLIRKKNNFLLNNESILEISELEMNLYVKFYETGKNKNNLDIKYEIQNILFFCYTENLINYVEWDTKSKYNKKALEISEDFLEELKKEIALDDKLVESIKNEIFRINQKWLYFHFKEATFVFENRKSYFQEIYFKCDSIVRTYLDQSSLEKLFEDKEEKVKVYYDYLFLLTALVPADIIEKPIYICVDFSRGNFYNKVIQNSITSFENLNIILEKKITANTQLYVSDFSLSGINCRQVVWKNPPGPKEWKNFGDIIVALKNEVVLEVRYE